jgi:hypothetical protein
MTARRRSGSLLAGVARAGGVGGPHGARHGHRPHERPWFRGLFRAHSPDAVARGLVASLACHTALGLTVLAGAFESAGSAARLSPASEATVVEIELPKIEPKTEIRALAPSREPAAALGDLEGPTPRGRRARKGRDPMEDAARAGVLGMLGKLGSKGYTDTRERGATPGPDQQSAEPFTGMAGLREYEGGALPVGGAGGGARGAGTDEGSGTGGGRGSGHAKDLLNSYGDGKGDAIILERRGSARGVEGGSGSGAGSGDDGCRDEAAIVRAVESHKGAIRLCYNTALESNPSLAGDVSVRFVVTESGGVRAAARVGQSLGDPALEACILARIREWTFAEESGCETIVRYTFHLSRAF